MESIKCRLKVLRAENDMTQDDLAKAVGVARQTVISIERGDYVPSLLLGMQLAQYFNKPVEEVFVMERKSR